MNKRIYLLYAATLCATALIAEDRVEMDSLALPTGKTDWVDPIRATPKNTHYVLYPTSQRGEGTEGSCMVYLPEEYATNKKKKYPVIYYLHGGSGNQGGEDG